jgi:hypothetical protein
MIPAAHIHISEREPDGTWEDCTWCSILEWFRLVVDPRKPATLAEAEAIRKASGEPTTGGSNYENAAVGIKRRYGYTLPARLTSFAALQKALTPGKVAAIAGSMRAFPPGHRLSKWDPGFDGGHAVLLMNIAGVLYWCDPEAPTKAAVPVIVTWTEVRQFVTAFSGKHVVGTIKVPPAPKPVEEIMTPYAAVTDTSPKLIDVLPGAVLVDLDGVKVLKTLTGTYKDQVSPFAVAGLRAWFATLGGIKRPVLVKTAANIRGIVDATPYSQAKLDSEKALASTVATDAEKSRLRKLLGL